MADFYSAYNQRRQQIEGEPTQQLQQASAVVGLQQALQQQAQSKQLQDLLSTTGGDAEKALAAALQSGNIQAAQHLAPIVKMQQEQKQREDTPRMLADIYRQSAGPQAQPAAPVAPDFPTASPQDAMVTPASPAPSQQDWRQQRLAQLTAQSLIPQYANNPVVAQRLQSEMDKLSSVKPLVEHNFSIGNNMVQPHISFDEGRSWEPVKGSKPSAKFAKQIESDAPVAATDDTLAMDAWRYLTDGTLPPNMGRGVQGTAQATKIRNESSRLAKEMGMTPDEIRMAQLTNKTQVQAIGQLAKAKAQILQFEKTASMNADLALQASEKVDRTGVPVLNRWLQAGRTNIEGDVDASKFNAATETFVSEYAKVMSGGYGAAATTEGAQSRAHSLLNTANTKEQFRGVVTQLKAEMNNRVKALNGQMDEERQNLRSGIRRPPADAAPDPGSPAPANPAMPDIKGAATQAWGAFEPDKFEYRMSNGKLQRKAK